jgi:hypothetical protein
MKRYNYSPGDNLLISKSTFPHELSSSNVLPLYILLTRAPPGPLATLHCERPRIVRISSARVDYAFKGKYQ